MYTLFLCLALVIVAGVSQAAASNLLRVLVREENSSKMSVAVTQPATLQIAGQVSRRLDPGKWYTLPLTSAYRITPSN
ncbi:MAG: SpoIID/LytB domain-containing protein, partial [Pseudanabaena sp.]